MQATLTTLTPVHIGNGQTLNKNIDFVQEGNKIGFFDLNKIVDLIGIDQIEQLTNIIDQNKPILDFLRKGRGLNNPLEDFCYKISSAKNISASTTQLKEHYHSSLKGICIPGSSLKGSMKTAIWDNILTDDILERTPAPDLKNSRGKWSDSKLDKKLFGQTANQKTTRFLKIGDVHFTKTDSVIYETIIINQRYEDWAIKDGNRFLLECIPSGCSANFNFLLDKQLLDQNIKRYSPVFKQLKTSNIEDEQKLFETINRFTAGILNWEMDELEGKDFDGIDEGNTMLDKYAEILDSLVNIKRNEAIIRLGGNNGWRFTTGGWITKQSLPLSDTDFSSLKQTIQKREYPDVFLLPKTRKTTSTGVPFGFVKITLQ